MPVQRSSPPPTWPPWPPPRASLCDNPTTHASTLVTTRKETAMSLSTSTISLATSQQPTTQILAVADLVQGSQGLYTMGVAILALFFLIAGGIGGAGALGSGRIGK